jgi:Putative ABC exporter
VIGTFLRLTAWSLKNRLVRRARRLREPRYLVGLVVGLGYVYWFLIRHQLRGARGAGEGFAAMADHAPALIAGGSLVLWLGAVLVWLWPMVGRTWSFTGAEVQFFFTAPVSRRQLLNYKLLRSQLGLLFGVMVASLFGGAARAATEGRWSFVLGGWLLLATVLLHVLGSNLTKASFRRPAGRVPWIAWSAAAVMALVSGVVIGSYAVQAQALASRPLGDALRGVVDATRSGLVAVALWPFAAVIRPIFAATPAAFVRALVPALGVLALNYWWVLVSDARLEEAAAHAEQRRGWRRRGLPVPVVRPAPFTLAPAGAPAVAVAWKNTIQLGRYASAATLVRVLIPIVVFAFVMGLDRRAESFALIALAAAGLLTIIGPYMIRNDLRMDLPRLPILKTWPIGGRDLLLGELLAPAAALSVAVWFLLAVAFALSSSWTAAPGGTVGRAVLGLAGAVLAPVLIAGQLIIQNGAAVLFPGWIATGGSRPRGIEAMGQNMLMFAGTLLALAVGVLPAAAAAGGLGFVSYALVGWPGVLPAAILFAALLAVEAALVLTWLGRVLERTEPSQVELAD